MAELLVVVGIVAVLIAILMPALSRARRAARSVVCLSNLRQLSVAFEQYRADHHGRTPFGLMVNNQENGLFLIEDHLLRPRGEGQQSGIMFCPAASEPPVKRQRGGDVWYDYPGAVFRPWGYPDRPYYSATGEFRGSSYGMNTWLDASKYSLSSRLPEAAIALPTKENSRIPLFADATHHWGWPIHTDPPPRSLMPHRTNGDNIADMAHVFCIPRHGRAINVVFLDGHARTIPLGELWHLKWNNVWVPTNVQMPPK